MNVCVDTYHTSLWVRLPSGFLELLEEQKKLAQSLDRAIPFEFNGTWWLLKPHAIKYYAFCLTSDDVSLFINKRDPEKSIPNVRLAVGSISSHAKGVEIFRSIYYHFTELGGSVLKDTISRLDLCYDLPQDIQNLPGLLDPEQRICNFKKFSAYWSSRQFSGCVFGKGDVVCRIYDKVREMNEKRDAKKISFFNFPGPTTRVEFQLRREYLTQFVTSQGKIYNTDQAFASIDELWTHLTHKTIRFVHPFDRKNNNYDTVTHTWWEMVQNQSKHEPAQRVRVPPRIVPDNNLAQAAGCLVPTCAVLENTTDYERVSERVFKEVKRILLKYYEKSFHKVQNAVIGHCNVFIPAYEQFPL